MRRLKYVLSEGRGGTAVLRVEVEEKGRKRAIPLTFAMGWRAELALRQLPRESGDGIDAARMYLGLQVLKCARDRQEGWRFLQIVRDMERFEVHFWSYCFLNYGRRARRGWRAFFGGEDYRV
ncbi:MAG: hypothetical protein QXH32_02100 [Candidatus Caldarchaeum sp.]